MTELLEPVRDLLGGGSLSLWLLLGGLVILWLALKAVQTFVKVALVVLGASLLASTAPWSGTALDGPAAACAAARVEAETTGADAWLTKRITVAELSEDARCNADRDGLAAGSAAVSQRTFFDLRLRGWEVSPGSAEPVEGLPTLPD